VIASGCRAAFGPTSNTTNTTGSVTSTTSTTSTTTPNPPLAQSTLAKALTPLVCPGSLPQGSRCEVFDVSTSTVDPTYVEYTDNIIGGTYGQYPGDEAAGSVRFSV
jgi:hypothetical protein